MSEPLLTEEDCALLEAHGLRYPWMPQATAKVLRALGDAVCSIEAQCAAMRACLENLQVDESSCEYNVPDQEYIQAALAPDAGRSLLAELEALRERVRTAEMGFYEERGNIERLTAEHAAARAALQEIYDSGEHLGEDLNGYWVTEVAKVGLGTIRTKEGR